mmetsp:Transcript_9367/g.24898  ORF Transcript_9367/g.24898 Transcript_9367/m.24898 type:complete len:342 (-) Transcript_9367:31-1056(-)
MLRCSALLDKQPRLALRVTSCPAVLQQLPKPHAPVRHPLPGLRLGRRRAAGGCSSAVAVGLEAATKDKPGEEALGEQREQDVDLLAVPVVAPCSDAGVLQRHVHGKRVEEEEVAKEDAVDKARDLTEIATAEKVLCHNNPGRQSRNTPVHEWRPVRFRALGRVEGLHVQPEEVHRGVDQEDADERREVVAAEERCDRANHDRGTQCILVPPRQVDPAVDVLDVPRKLPHDAQVRRGGEQQKNGRGQADLEGSDTTRPGLQRFGHFVENKKRCGDVFLEILDLGNALRSDEHEKALHEMQTSGTDVPFLQRRIRDRRCGQRSQGSSAVHGSVICPLIPPRAK